MSQANSSTSANIAATAPPKNLSAPTGPVKLGPGEILNKYGEVEGIDLKIADWARRWEKANTQWHRAEVHPVLVKNADKFHVQPSGDNHPWILLPLSGKSVDLVWLYERGWNVVGVEIVTQAIIDFFYENSGTFPKFIVEKLPGTPMYRYSTPDGRLSIIQADIFSDQLTTEVLQNATENKKAPGFDVTWDRGSLQALNPGDRERYVAAMDRWLTPGASYLLSVNRYDQSQMYGPPFSVPEDVVDRLYSKYERQLLEVEPPVGVWNGEGKPKVELTYLSYFMRKPQ